MRYVKKHENTAQTQEKVPNTNPYLDLLDKDYKLAVINTCQKKKKERKK